MQRQQCLRQRASAARANIQKNSRMLRSFVGDTGSDGETVAVPSGITGVKLDDGGIGVDGICVGMDSSTGKLPETLCDCIDPDMMGVCGKMPSPTGELCAIGVLGCWESISLVAIVGLESTLFSQCGVESC